MTQHPKIYVAGHRGMVGSAIVRHLLANGQPADRIVTRTHAELDLLDQSGMRETLDDLVTVRKAPVHSSTKSKTHSPRSCCGL